MKSALILILAISTVLLSSLPVLADCTGVPDLDRSVIWQAYDGPATLLVVPDGSGNPLSAARTPDGVEVDATINLTLITFCEFEGPVVGFPREDLWLESWDGGMTGCQGGTIADYNTDTEGTTQWSQPLEAGGWDEGETWIMASGMPIYGGTGLSLNFNSPDINGDRLVNLSDLVEFTEDYFGGFSFRSDFMRDGSLNLSDVAIMASSMGVGCP